MDPINKLVAAIESLAINENQDQPYVFFDLETTGFGPQAEVIQIAAVTANHEFSVYIYPTCGIHPQASNATNLYKTSHNLFYKDEKVKTVPKKTAWEQFFSYVRHHAPVFLIGHNIKTFDLFYLIRDLEECKLLNDFSACIYSTIDTLPLFKKLYSGVKSYRQQTVYEFVIGGGYEAHNALADVRALQEIFLTIPENHVEICNHNFDFLEHINMRRTKSDLKHLKEYGISNGIIQKLVAGGLTLSMLTAAYTSKSNDGVRAAIKTITFRKDTIENICNAVSKCIRNEGEMGTSKNIPSSCSKQVKVLTDGPGTSQYLNNTYSKMKETSDCNAMNKIVHAEEDVFSTACRFVNTDSVGSRFTQIKMVNKQLKNCSPTPTKVVLLQTNTSTNSSTTCVTYEQSTNKKLGSSVSRENPLRNINNNLQKNYDLKTLQDYDVKAYSIKKMKDKGITLENLRNAYLMEKWNGVEDILKDVLKNKPTINKICEAIEAYVKYKE